MTLAARRELFNVKVFLAEVGQADVIRFRDGAGQVVEAAFTEFAWLVRFAHSGSYGEFESLSTMWRALRPQRGSVERLEVVRP